MSSPLTSWNSLILKFLLSLRLTSFKSSTDSLSLSFLLSFDPLLCHGPGDGSFLIRSLLLGEHISGSFGTAQVALMGSLCSSSILFVASLGSAKARALCDSQIADRLQRFLFHNLSPRVPCLPTEHMLVQPGGTSASLQRSFKCPTGSSKAADLKQRSPVTLTMQKVDMTEIVFCKCGTHVSVQHVICLGHVCMI